MYDPAEERASAIIFPPMPLLPCLKFSIEPQCWVGLLKWKEATWQGLLSQTYIPLSPTSLHLGPSMMSPERSTKIKSHITPLLNILQLLPL